jgi:hypothetical protein
MAASSVLVNNDGCRMALLFRRFSAAGKQSIMPIIEAGSTSSKFPADALSWHPTIRAEADGNRLSPELRTPCDDRSVPTTDAPVSFAVKRTSAASLCNDGSTRICDIGAHSARLNREAQLA